MPFHFVPRIARALSVAVLSLGPIRLGATPLADTSVYAVIPRPSVLTPAAGHFALRDRKSVGRERVCLAV